MSLDRRSWLASALAITATTSLLAADTDWPTWRGPKRDAISNEKGLLASWPEDGPPLAWRIDNVLGNGMSSIAISGGKIFTMGRIDGDECLICLDQKDGKLLWKTELGTQGEPNCTPTVDGDLVYGLGRDGVLICCKVADGSEVWKVSYGKDFGGKMMSGWGYSESPLVDGNALIVTPGAPDAIIAALDKKTGKTLWKTAMPSDAGKRGGDGAAYSSVVICNAGGVKQYVQLVGRGVIGVDAKDGKLLWGYNNVANDTANIPTPLVKGDYVFCSTGYGTGSALLKIAKQGKQLVPQEVYFLKADDMQNHHGGMILLGDYVYCGHGHNQGFPLCIEIATGKPMWKPGRGPGGGSAAVAYADGHLYFRYEDGVMALIEANPKEYKLTGKFKLATHHGNSWPHPVIAGGKLYCRDQGTLLVYNISAK